MHPIKLFLMSLSLMAAGACSSNPTSSENASGASSIASRSAYVDYASKRLSNLENETRKLDPGSRAQLQANIADAKIELAELQSATDSNWLSYRDRMESSLSRIETAHNLRGR